ncbi:inorganic pyrophosphatase [Acidaminobacter sp. JC074]|uniref:inorganic diphosphatase n=1 Tax=Acidaminobacter sp. JC074 TaxID=2530199 RepID=UPI001F0E0A3D|nr:inorganic diphosphatase [Acidaminobacter sp. JC074]MCH4886147.1 inorganic pyrophosphatase [Acidaminobacter sp. JC074]
MNIEAYLNTEVEVIIDRPLGKPHPRHKDMIYPVNYGYLENTVAGDGHELDAYVLGPKEAVESFKGIVIAIVYREDDVEEKLVVAKDHAYSEKEILDAIWFTEQYFKSSIKMAER